MSLLTDASFFLGSRWHPLSFAATATDVAFPPVLAQSANGTSWSGATASSNIGGTGVNDVRQALQFTVASTMTVAGVAIQDHDGSNAGGDYQVKIRTGVNVGDPLASSTVIASGQVHVADVGLAGGLVINIPFGSPVVLNPGTTYTVDLYLVNQVQTFGDYITMTGTRNPAGSALTASTPRLVSVQGGVWQANNDGWYPRFAFLTAGAVDTASRVLAIIRSASDQAAPNRLITTFSDNFNRADGPLGSPWTTGPTLVDNFDRPDGTALNNASDSQVGWSIADYSGGNGWSTSGNKLVHTATNGAAMRLVGTGVQDVSADLNANNAAVTGLAVGSQLPTGAPTDANPVLYVAYDLSSGQVYVRLYCSGNDTVVNSATGLFTYVLNTTVRVRVTYNTSSRLLTVYWAGAQIWQTTLPATDLSGVALPSGGYAGIASTFTGVTWDNVTMTATGATIVSNQLSFGQGTYFEYVTSSGDRTVQATVVSVTTRAYIALGALPPYDGTDSGYSILTDSGTYHCGKWGTTPASGVLAAGPHTFAISCHNNGDGTWTITYTIDGTVVATVQDNNGPGSADGVGTGASGWSYGGPAVFDDFSISTSGAPILDTPSYLAARNRTATNAQSIADAATRVPSIGRTATDTIAPAPSAATLVQSTAAVANNPTFGVATTAGNTIALLVTTNVPAQSAPTGFTQVYDSGYDAAAYRTVIFVRQNAPSTTQVNTAFTGQNIAASVIAVELAGTCNFFAGTRDPESGVTAAATLSDPGNGGGMLVFGFFGNSNSGSAPTPNGWVLLGDASVYGGSTPAKWFYRTVASYPVVFSDTSSVVGTDAFVMGFQRQANPADTARRVLAIVRAGSESTTQADSASRVLTFPRVGSDGSASSTQVPSWVLTLNSNDMVRTLADWPVTNPTKQVAGVVYGTNNAPYLGGATVDLIRDVDGLQCATTTSSAVDGSYAFVRDANDPYTYTVRAYFNGVGGPIEDVTQSGLVPN